MSPFHNRTSVPRVSHGAGQNGCPTLSLYPLGHCNPSDKQPVASLSHTNPLGHFKTPCFSLQLQCPKLSLFQRGACQPLTHPTPLRTEARRPHERRTT